MCNTRRTRRASADTAGAPALHERIYPSKFDSAEPFDPELTAEGLVAGCGSIFDILRFAVQNGLTGAAVSYA